LVYEDIIVELEEGKKFDSAEKFLSTKASSSKNYKITENYSTCINTNLNTDHSPESSDYYDPLYSSRTNPNSLFTFCGEKSSIQQPKVPK